MTEFIGQIKSSTQLRWNRLHKFKPKITFQVELGPYAIKTVETFEELTESFRLRHEVFNREFRGLEGPGLDFDRFDFHFDHLIIKHRETKEIIGTYRLNCSRFSRESYTALEFDLSMMNLYQGPHLELGRACIHRDHRKGTVISMLWRGIAEYMNRSGAQLLFGCSSLKLNEPRDAALVYSYLLSQGNVRLDLLARPTEKYKMPGLDAWMASFQSGLLPEQVQEAESKLPSLLKSYLKLGARVACEPAFDAEFDCIDMLTILHKEDMSQSLVQKFGKLGEGSSPLDAGSK